MRTKLFTTGVFLIVLAIIFGLCAPAIHHYYAAAVRLTEGESYSLGLMMLGTVVVVAVVGIACFAKSVDDTGN